MTGTIDDTCAEEYTSVETPPTLSNLISGGSKSVNTSETLSTGDYKFSSLSVAGNGMLTLSGAIRLYVTGNLSVTGNGKIIINDNAVIYLDGTANIAGNGFINSTNAPSNLLLFSSYAGASDGVTISGNGDFYGAIYAPDTEIKIAGNGDTYGSVIGGSFTVTGNGNIHYDESLNDLGAECSITYAQQEWRDTQNPYPLQ